METPETTLELKDPLFDLGRIVVTRGALALYESRPAGMDASAIHLYRHQTGDWGEVCDEDKATNDQAVKDGNRILSCYHLDNEGEQRVWIITEHDRSSTTFLLPEEY
jgi:hypothetical protein